MDEVNADLREYMQLKKEGVSCSFAWLVETHFFDEYGLKMSRQACSRHINRCLGLK